MARCRTLARGCAERYLTHREELGWPAPERQARPHACRLSARAARRLVFEIGTEELPPQAAWDGARQLRDGGRERVQAARIATGTPSVLDAPAARADRRGRRGASGRSGPRSPRPRRQVAFTPDGRPSPAAEGFARAQGVAGGALERRTTPQGEYVYAVRREPGAPTSPVLAELLPKLAGGLAFLEADAVGDGDRPVRAAGTVAGGAVRPAGRAVRIRRGARGTPDARPSEPPPDADQRRRTRPPTTRAAQRLGPAGSGRAAGAHRGQAPATRPRASGGIPSSTRSCCTRPCSSSNCRWCSPGASRTSSSRSRARC